MSIRSGDHVRHAAPAALARPSTLKARHRAMWASGDYPRVAREMIAPLGPRLVEACEVEPGDRVLDVAAGSGNAAIPAALRGAEVTAADLTPELFRAGRRRALARGADIDWIEADAEALPFESASFDVVMSCVGVMFAPDHEQAATELIRVCARGGTIGILAWTPESVTAQMFSATMPYAPPPPAGFRSPALWGVEDHVRDLLGDDAEVETFDRELLEVRFPTPEASRDFFKATYGPVIAAYRNIAADGARTAQLDRDLAQVFTATDRGAPGAGRWEYEYAITIARRR